MESPPPPPRPLTLEEALKLIASGKTNLRERGKGIFGKASFKKLGYVLMNNAEADLWLGDEDIGICAMPALSVILPHSSLVELRLSVERSSGDNTPDAGKEIKKLAEILPATRIRHLHMYRMGFGEEGAAAALAAALPATRITVLTLDYCFDPAGKDHVAFRTLMLSALPKLASLKISNACHDLSMINTIVELLPLAKTLQGLSLPHVMPPLNWGFTARIGALCEAVERSALQYIKTNSCFQSHAADNRVSEALARAASNRRILAFVSGFVVPARTALASDRTPVWTFLNSDGDLALQHRVAWFLVE